MAETSDTTLHGKRVVTYNDDAGAPNPLVNVCNFDDSLAAIWDPATVRVAIRAIAAQQPANHTYRIQCAQGLSRSVTFAILFLWLAGPSTQTLWEVYTAVRDHMVGGNLMSERLVQAHLEALLTAIGIRKSRHASFEDWAKGAAHGVARQNLW